MKHSYIKPEDKLYKYIPWKYLKLMLSTGQICFCKVPSWEKADAFENMLRRQYLYTSDFYVDVHSITELLYGQSWSCQGESKRMWEEHSKIHSDGDFSVLVKTTAKNIEDMVEPRVPVGQNSIRFLRGIMGKVSYFTEEQIDSWFLGLGDITLDQVNDLNIEYTFMKKECYSFENEIRRLVRDIDEKHKEMLSFGIDPQSFFESFVIDYRLSEQKQTEVKDEIISLGIDPERVKPSVFL